MVEGSLTLRQEDLDLCEVVSQAVTSARGQASANHKLTLATPNQPVRVIADRRGLSTIAHNLLDNAIKYSPGGGEIVCNVLAESTWAELEVRDHGLGIEPEQFDQLFRPFGRIVTNETADIRGTGLGLYMARELARLQGGDITVESERGRGSTFTMRVPLASVKEQGGQPVRLEAGRARPALILHET
jgi:signal transduction histidine kinase